MTPKEKYIKALKELLAAQKEVQASENNPFHLGMPSHLGLSEETFITDAQLSQLSTEVSQAANDNQKFTKLWNLGTEIALKAKEILL